MAANRQARHDRTHARHTSAPRRSTADHRGLAAARRVQSPQALIVCGWDDSAQEAGVDVVDVSGDGDVWCGVWKVAARSKRGFRVERVTRIELAFSAWEADVLPLNYTRVGTARFLARNPVP